MPHRDLEAKRKYFQEYYQKNKERLGEYRRAYRRANPILEVGWQSKYRDKGIEERRWAAILRRYDLTKEDFDRMLVKQGGKCACCGEVFSKTPHVDHCHTSGRVRGLLCGPCNTGLGVFEKKAALFKQYLERHLGG